MSKESANSFLQTRFSPSMGTWKINIVPLKHQWKSDSQKEKAEEEKRT